MTGFIGFLFILVIYGVTIAVAIFLLVLLGRFVKASERLASATEEIARKLRDDSKA